MSAHTFKGFGVLQKPVDLLGKLQHDFERLQNAPHDAYAAFDFFVTAYHILDWLHPNDDKGRKDEEAASPLLQICSHLANGAKHFEVKAKQHSSVQDVRSEPPAFQRDAFDASAFQVGDIVIRLDGQAASLFGAEVQAIDLAGRILAHWESDSRIT